MVSKFSYVVLGPLKVKMKSEMFREMCIRKMTLKLVNLVSDVFIYLQFFIIKFIQLKIGRMRTGRGGGSRYMTIFF